MMRDGEVGSVGDVSNILRGRHYPIIIYTYVLCDTLEGTENVFSQYFLLGNVKKSTKTQGLISKVCIICIMDAFCIWIHQ